MPSRPEFRLSDEDLIASAQILGWLAFPDRPLHGISIIQQWAIRRGRARGAAWAESSPIRLDALNRLQMRIDRLDMLVRRRLRAGEMLSRRACRAAGTPLLAGLGASLRALTGGSPNRIRDEWTKSVPVIHLAEASLYAVLDAYRREGRRHWHLERAIFWPDWVPQAIEESERRAQLASRLGIVPIERMVDFHR